MTAAIQKRKPLTARQRDAMHRKCAECNKSNAEEFCGCWRNDLGGECHRPLCRSCADVRLGIWRCNQCKPKTER